MVVNTGRRDMGTRKVAKWRERGASLVEAALLLALVVGIAVPSLSALANVSKPVCQAECALIDWKLFKQNRIGWFLNPITGKGYCKKTVNLMAD